MPVQQPSDHGFHAGELAVQQAAGVEQEAARLEGMLDPADLGGGAVAFLAGQSFAAMTGRGRDGRLWTSPLVGPPGFLHVTGPKSLQIPTGFLPADPLHELTPGQPVGLIAIDYSRRRRFRINGTLDDVDPRGLAITVDEAYGNCPQFIPQRTFEPVPTVGRGHDPHLAPAPASTDADTTTIRTADTFLLGTAHPRRGSDASHRGGPPGFVRVKGNLLWWPDYAGNNMFNSLGNLHVNPEAALLFLDFADHSALHVNGTAELVTVGPGSPGDDGHTGRRIVFTVRHSLRTPLSAGSELIASYPRNPPVTG